MERDEVQPEQARPVWRRTAIAALGLIVLTLVIYTPAMRGGFVWDDDLHLINNIVLKQHGLYRTWCTTEPVCYYPVVWTSYWLEHQLWGLNPTGYHVVNVLLHAASALLIWRILVRLKIPGALAAALIFAVHPVNVESVAWITQRKNTLSMFFFLVALAWYLRFDDHGRRGSYCLAVASFLLAMLSKGAIVTLPVVLLGCAWWLRGTITRRDVWRSLPFFAVSAFMSIVEVWFQYGRAIGTDVVRTDSFFARLAGAGWVVWFYLYKALLPIRLSFVYPRWEIDPTNWLSYVPGLVLLALLGLCWRYRRSRGRPVLFALGYFVVTLAPALGFVDFYFVRYSFVADHYQYVSIIGIIALVVAVGCRATNRLGVWGRSGATVALGLVLLVLGTLTWQQGHIYHDPETLWRDTLRKNPRAWMAHNNLGVLLEAQGESDEAIEHYRQALEVNPDFSEAHNNWGNVLQAHGKSDEAIDHYRQALEIKPDNAKAHNNLGVAFKSQDKLTEAIGHYRLALRLKPYDAGVHNNLGLALRSQGELDEAIRHCRQALEIKPDFAQAHANLGNALLARGESDEAINHYRQALRIESHDAATLTNLGSALLAQGESDEAIRHYRQALEVDPGFTGAHINLGSALAAQGKSGEALSHYRQVVRLNPDHADSRVNLGVELLRQGRREQAVAEYRAALRIDPQHAAAHYNLGNALSARGKLDEAMSEYRLALRSNPRYVDALINLGGALRKRGQIEAAIEQYRQAIRISPGNVVAHCNLAATLAAEGRDAEALEVIREALRIDPHHTAARKIFDALEDCSGPILE